MTDLNALKQANAKRWQNAKLTRSFSAVAARLVASNAKQRYQTVSLKTGVPWYFIAVVHEREASQKWDTHLGQGDPLSEVTRHVPVGEPAFKTWEEGAYDALVNCGPYAARNKDWSIGGLLTMLEQYNGLKYAMAGRPSPYLWAGTDQYTTGKVLVDHGPIEDIYPSGPNKGKPVIDPQPGCAGLLIAMMALDPSIVIERPGAVILPPPKLPPDVPKPLPPSVTHPAPGSIGAFIASIFAAIAAIFRRK